jgi:hypothetical protein
MEDQIQRLAIPLGWSLPRPGEIREIAERIWNGSLGEELSQTLGPEAVADLFGLWDEHSRASDILRIRLKTLIALHPFPGSCSDCSGLQYSTEAGVHEMEKGLQK